MKGRRAIKFAQLTAIVVTAVFVGVLIALYDHFLLLTPVVKEISPSYNFLGELAYSIAASFTSGAIGGAFLVYYVQDRFSDKPYGYTLLALLIGLIVVITLVSLPLVAIYTTVLTQKPFTDPASLKLFNELFFHRLNPVIFVWVPVVALQQLMLQVFNKFGPGVFWKIVRGKYYTPKHEHRIFMFVDLNSSTTIAEKLGNERYHELLKDFFADITNSILNYRGEIYQYLGDGVIIVWNAYADERDIRCIECFFDMKKEIQSKSDKYIRKFELLPGIKAGIHSGEVIVGEIGIIKRDITYSGDVVNTTARIESMCNELQSEVLISNELLQQLPRDSKFAATSVGAIHLKGKEKEVELISLHLN